FSKGYGTQAETSVPIVSHIEGRGAALQRTISALAIEPNAMAQQQPGEHVIIEPNTLVFYIDDTGDERLSDQQHPVFAFGGVATVSEFHVPIGQGWRAMK